MTELFINEKLNQLLELDYDAMPEDPLNMMEDDGVRFFIETGDVITDLIDTLFDGDENVYQVEHDKYTNANDLFEGLGKIAKKQGKLVFPITKYEHSQVRYYLGADQGWDSGVTGFVLVDLKQAKQNFNLNNKAEIERYLDGLLDMYTEYVNGNVYGVAIYELNSRGERGDEIDYIGNLLPNNTNIEGIFNLGLLGGCFEDWKKATKKVTTSYISVG